MDHWCHILKSTFGKDILENGYKYQCIGPSCKKSKLQTFAEIGNTKQPT